MEGGNRRANFRPPPIVRRPDYSETSLGTPEIGSFPAGFSGWWWRDRGRKPEGFPPPIRLPPDQLCWLALGRSETSTGLLPPLCFTRGPGRGLHDSQRRRTTRCQDYVLTFARVPVSAAPTSRRNPSLAGKLTGSETAERISLADHLPHPFSLESHAARAVHPMPTSGTAVPSTAFVLPKVKVPSFESGNILTFNREWVNGA